MNFKTKKLLAHTAVGITGAAAVSFAVTDYLMRLALDRKGPWYIPISREYLIGSKEDSEFAMLRNSAAAALEKRVSEHVCIEAADGTPLVEHLWHCDKPERVVVAMHGWRSSWSQDFGIIADFWHDSGCSILFAEQRGQGNSGGRHMGFGLTERYDCLDWVNYVNTLSGSALPIYLCGVSMGASTILMASDLDLPGNVHGIIADCAFTSPDAVWRHVVKDNLHLSYGIRGLTADAICRRKLKVGSKSCSTVMSLGKTAVPVLFIHGTDDRFVPIEMTYENYTACASQKQLFVVPGAGHAMSYIVDRNGYEGAVRRFWERYDRL